MQLHTLSSQEQQTTELAKAISNRLVEIINQNGRAVIAVSGGKSPIALFAKLSKEELPWEKVTITLVDERFTDVTHEDSNENLVRKNLLINNAEQAFFIGLVTTRNIISSTANANLQVPKIDIAILGMGEDGHTASIFPCCKELDTVLDTLVTTEKYVITSPTTANYQRVGLSLSAILQIPYLFLSINGEKKLAIINDAQQITKKYPTSYVIANRQDLEVFWF